MSVVGILHIWVARDNCALCCCLNVAKTREVDSSLTSETTAVTYLYIYLTLLIVEDNRLTNEAVVTLSGDVADEAIRAAVEGAGFTCGKIVEKKGLFG